MRRLPLPVVTLALFLLSGGIVAAHAGGVHIFADAGPYRIDLELETADTLLYAETSVPLVLRLNNRERAEPVSYSEVDVMISGPGQETIFSGTLMEDDFLVGGSTFAIYVPRSGTYEAAFVFREGSGEEVRILAEASAMQFSAEPPADEAGDSGSTSAHAPWLVSILILVFALLYLRNRKAE